MEGALLLSAAAFFAAGGGIARAVTPSPSFAAAGPGLQPSLMWMTADGLPQTERDELSFRSPDSFVIGPGLSREDAVHHADAFIQMIRKSSEERLMRNQTPPFIILDAAACSLIFHSDYPEPLRCRTLLTPHSGEWASLGGSPIHSKESFSKAVLFSTENLRCWSLIKDAVSVLIPPPPAEDPSHCSGVKRKPLIFPHPEPSLATAGTGDSLSGILAAAFSGKRGHLHDPYSMECAVQQKIHHSMNLLHAAVTDSVHPVSSDFAAGIRRALL